MKQCPTCRTTYTDETLRFCLADGAPLNDIAAEQPTVVRQSGGPSDDRTAVMNAGQLRVEIPQDASPKSPQQYQAAPASGGSGGLLKVLLLMLGLGFVAVLIAFGGILFYYNSRSDIAANNRADLKPPLPSPPATRNDTDELRGQIANLQKQIADQKNGPANSAVPSVGSFTPLTTARVNSPGDGFLALRTLPNGDRGDRIAKIPHGQMISIGACGPSTRAGGRSGRWCQASYGGHTGYVFDGWLDY
jgi:hypothetical protein